MFRDKLLNICAYIFQKEQEMMEQNGMYAAEYDENGAYMEQEEEWEREGLLDPAWEKQQKKVSESDVTWTLSAMRWMRSRMSDWFGKMEYCVLIIIEYTTIVKWWENFSADSRYPIHDMQKMGKKINEVSLINLVPNMNWRKKINEKSMV